MCLMYCIWFSAGFVAVSFILSVVGLAGDGYIGGVYLFLF